ncbi:hypothetical protein [Mesorhizobium wenxiniae]|uniref:Uncharacterized protein n=1 Tax=Mesorhizobium wenxiniae TaxID=2014805 RepID=A0A271KEU4_9HYPH|nr:hypothetical protein [Mesorhizobium wenxiniae]PAP93984.1 hypothetical protein CIT31_16590 [Mesorhizobium wenxiniae]
MLPGIAGIMAGIGAAFEATFLSSTNDDSNAADYSFGSESFGDAASGREIFVSVSWGGDNNARTISSATIGGVSATVHDQDSIADGISQSVGAGVISAEVPSGTSGTIEVNFSGTVRSCAIGTVRVLNRSAIVDTAVDTANQGGSPATTATTINVSAKGALIAAYMNSDTDGDVIWTGVTETYDGTTSGASSSDNSRYSGALSTGLSSQSNRPVSTSQVVGGASGSALAVVSIA